MAEGKTVATRMVEGMLTSFLGSVVQDATANAPPIKLAEEGQPITIESVMKQLDLAIKTEPKSAVRIALMLACMLARQEGIGEKEALMFAGLAWGQTSNLTRR